MSQALVQHLGPFGLRPGEGSSHSTSGFPVGDRPRGILSQLLSKSLALLHFSSRCRGSGDDFSGVKTPGSILLTADPNFSTFCFFITKRGEEGARLPPHKQAWPSLPLPPCSLHWMEMMGVPEREGRGVLGRLHPTVPCRWLPPEGSNTSAFPRLAGRWMVQRDAQCCENI